MPTRILSISGLRGIVGDGLEPGFLSRFARAVGRLTNGGTIVVSRDGRDSGMMVREAVLAGLAAEGAQGREGRQESPSERARTRGPSSVPLALHKRELLFHDVSIYASASIVAI